MKKLKSKNLKFKILLTVFFAVVFLVLTSALVLAQDQFGLEFIEPTGLGTKDIRQTIAEIIRVALGLLGLIVLVIVLYGGFLWMTAGGNEEKITKAKKLLINGLIGLLIILTSVAIVTFLINHIAAATGYSGREPPGPGPGPGGGPGNRVIESYYPTGNERGNEIPGRDVSILITFRMQIKPETIIANCAGGSCLQNGVYSGFLKSEAFELFYSPLTGPRQKIIDADDPPNDDNQEIIVSTRDKKIYKFDPVNLLPTDSDINNYQAEVGCNLQDEKGALVFGQVSYTPCFSWSFRITNQIDRIPPYVVSVLPSHTIDPLTTVPINHIVQIRFSEPVDPLVTTGEVKTCVADSDCSTGTCEADGYCTGKNFNYLEIKGTWTEDSLTYTDKIVNGRYLIDNSYRIVEFVTDEFCGTNSCGGDVYCLPKNATINALIISANLKTGPDPAKPYEAVSPADGVVDLANNSFDGNGINGQGGTGYDNQHGISVGPSADNFVWQFYTNDKLDLEQPELIALDPNGTQGLKTDPAGIYVYNPRAPILATFSKTMRATTFIKDNIALRPVPQPVPPDMGKEVFYLCLSGETPEVLVLEHFQFWPESYYAPVFDWLIQDTSQNCFQPCLCQDESCECTVNYLDDDNTTVNSLTPEPCSETETGGRSCISGCVYNQADKTWEDCDYGEE